MMGNELIFVEGAMLWIGIKGRSSEIDIDGRGTT